MADDTSTRRAATAERAQLRVAITQVASEELKNHMLRALNEFEAAEAPSLLQTQQSESDRNDPVTTALRAKHVFVKTPRTALFLAVHALMLEAGFRVEGSETGAEFVVPPGWEANDATGDFAGRYRHPNSLATTTFALQGLFVGNKFEVYLSAGEQTHSIELSVEDFVALDAAAELPALGADLLRNLELLRQKLLPFLLHAVPEKSEVAGGSAAASPAPPAPPSAPTRPGDYPFPAPQGLPPVGSGDVLPPGLGGGDPGMLVGPDSALFGRRFDPSRGPVPGARFDPFGPPIDPLRMPGRGGRGGFQPGPNLPFGTPNPDHLRMPREDDEMDFGFGRQPPPGRGGNNGGFGGGSRPFGSDHSFF